MIYGRDLGLSEETRTLLTTSHVRLGYLFAANLLWRLVWGFTGTTCARWTTIMPDLSSIKQLKTCIVDFIYRRSSPTIGRTPLVRVAVTIIYFTLFLQAASGIFLAINISFTTFFKNYFAVVAETHYYSYFVLLGLAVLHIGVVIVTEIVEGGAIISAMVNGRKYIPVNRKEEVDK